MIRRDAEHVTNGHTSPIGERVHLKNGVTIESPSAVVLEHLAAADPRVRYFPTPDIETAGEYSPGQTYYRAISDPLGRAVRQDFGEEAIAIRGTTAALEFSFPFWLDHSGQGTTACNDVLTILQIGSDDGRDEARVGFMTEDGEMNVETVEHLFTHWFGTYMELGKSPEGDQIFPVLIVYRHEAFAKPPLHGFNEFSAEPSERIAAIYITDRTTI
jgi:hypothetical protein